ncbi:MAG: hypothetical protein WCI77_06925 [Candidatus Omnitrophota bacterium]
MIFRKLEKEFFEQLKNKNNPLRYILDFEREHRKSFMVEIRKNFLDLYFLGHTIEVRSRGNGYYLIASKEFNPEKLLIKTPKSMIKPYGKNKWQIRFDDIENYGWFKDIMSAAIAQIVRHKGGNISEGVSEVNHFIDNRAIGKNGILVIDRQVVYPRSGKGRIDLLGLKRLPGGKFTFSIIELKNKNNKEIEDVFTRQIKRYIDLVYDKYDDFVETYEEVLRQKVKLRLLKPIDCKLARKHEISKKDIEGIAILDNYNIKGDLKANGLLERAIRDWAKIGSEYTARLFLKTNVLDDTFMLDLDSAKNHLNKYKTCNL